jgi:hypothetical protein
MAARVITQPIVVVCEGPSDCGLINALVRHHLLDGIQAICPEEQSGGFTQLPNLLTALSQQPRWRTMRGFFLVVDANGNIPQRLSDVSAFLTPHNLQVTSPFVVENGSPARAVYLLPGPNKTGCLEHLLLDAIQGRDPNLIACVDTFASCVQAPLSWHNNLQAKMKVHSLVAGCCKDDPASALSRVWNFPSNPIPISSAVFTGLANLLKQFATIAMFFAVAATFGWPV